MTAGPPTVPLCVDLDGTLVRTDLLHEGALELLRQAPLEFARMPFRLRRGKAAMKHWLADRIALEVAQLPYRADVLTLIEQARQDGRRVVLATAAAPQVAAAVADHLGLFDMVVSSDDTVNLSARIKAERLVELFGERGFDYIGNDRVDLPVWRRARLAIVVSRSGRLRALAAAEGREVAAIVDPPSPLRAALRSLRPHQWLKNLLVFAPLFAAHRLGDPALVLAAFAAFAAFSAAASFGYLVNDLLDLQADRRHLRKRARPFAAGMLSVGFGAGLAGGALTIAALLATTQRPLFAAVLGLYLALTLSYSLRLKRQVIVDVILLAGLYTLRIIAGAAATAITPSFWLLAFSMFVFLSLAIVKRYSEFSNNTAGKLTALAGRGYTAADLPVLMALGAGSGLMSVMVLALYVDSPAVATIYRTPQWLWLAPPVMLYWVARLWMKTHRGEVHDDPVVFAMTDRQSLIVALLTGVAFALADSGLTLS